MYIVAIKREKDNPYIYDWIASFKTAEAAESFAIKFADSIVVYDVE